MTHPQNPQRIMAFAPSSKGLGFVVLETPHMLVNWGVKSISKENKNADSLKKSKQLIEHYRPDVLVLENCRNSQRHKRIQKLIDALKSLGLRHQVKVVLLSQEQVRKTLFADGRGTKHELATLLAEEFPEELAARLPSKRRPWNSEAHGMGIFDAANLAWAFQVKESRQNVRLKEPNQLTHGDAASSSSPISGNWGK